MQKILTLFERDWDTPGNPIFNRVTPGAEWVTAGEGMATRKYDGTCCMIRDGVLYKRYDAKQGKTPPEGFEPAQDPDPVTGHWPGWLKVGDGPEDKWFRAVKHTDYPDGTYELIGPKIQGNPEGVPEHILMHHGATVLFDAPRDFKGLKQYLEGRGIEGIVWHHPDGRMVKIKTKDFGLKRE